VVITGCTGTALKKLFFDYREGREPQGITLQRIFYKPMATKLVNEIPTVSNVTQQQVLDNYYQIKIGIKEIVSKLVEQLKKNGQLKIHR